MKAAAAAYERPDIGFASDRTSYQVGVASTVAIATVTPTVNHPGAGVAYTPDDADDVTPGHQVDLSEGRNPVTITVTAEDGSTQDYTVSVNRGVTTGFGWNAEHDLDGIIAGAPSPATSGPTAQPFGLSVALVLAHSSMPTTPTGPGTAPGTSPP